MKILLLLLAALLVIGSSIRLKIEVLMPFNEGEFINQYNSLLHEKEQSGIRGNKTDNLLPVNEPPSVCQDMGYTNKKVTTDLKPVIIAGYPGSGNDLSRTIVQRLTGLDGNDIYTEQGNCSTWRRAATCKTHYPVIDTFPPESMRDSFASTAAILIRNPAKAIPSFFNFVWEYEHSLADHSRQGPEDEWIKWRDEAFDDQIEQWFALLVYWFDNWDIQTVIPYERLTQPKPGPFILQQLAQQLESSGFLTASDYQCQWYDCVVRSAKVKRAPHQYSPSYTLTQKRKIIDVVNQTLAHFSYHDVLAQVLQQYMLEIDQDVRVVD
jgi:hypothetical protein